MEITSLNQILFIVTMFVLALLLMCCKNPDIKTSKKYETSRLLSVVAFVVMGIHFMLQYHYKIRINIGNDVSALVNMLFYSVVTSLLCLSMINLMIRKVNFQKVVLPGIVLYIALVVTAIAGLLIHHSVHIGDMLVLCGVCFFFIQAFYIYKVLQAFRDVKKITDQYFCMYANQFLGWIRNVGIAFICFCAIMPFGIFYKIVVNSLAPVLLIILIYYVARFVTFCHIEPDLAKAILYYDVNNEKQGGDDSVDFGKPELIVVAEPDDKNGVVTRDVDSRQETNQEQAIAETCEDNHRDCQYEVESRKQDDDMRGVIELKLSLWINAKEYCNPNITLGVVARQLLVSDTQLSGFINKIYGINYNQWVNTLRIEEAKRLILEYENIKLEVISEECGFKTRNHFHRVFKEITKETPSAWRDSHRNKESGV